MNDYNMTHFFIPLTDWSLMRFQGLKTKAFLQGQLTIHLDTVDTAQAALAAYCNPKGRVISLFYLFYAHDCYYGLMPTAIAIRMQHILKPYAALSRVNITLMNDTHIWGLDKYTFEKTFNTQSNHIYHLDSHDIIFPVYSQNNSCKRHIWISKQIPTISVINDIDYWHLADLEIGIPWFNEKNSELFLPQELHLIQKNAVHLNKGCYVGQEIISRIHYRSQFQRELYLVKSTIPILIAEDIFYQHQPVGKIIDVVSIYKEQDSYFALVTATTAFTLDTPLFSDITHKHSLELVRTL